MNRNQSHNWAVIVVSGEVVAAMTRGRARSAEEERGVGV